MDLDTFLGSRVCIVSGKGGTGKTTVSAVLARVAAADGRRVLLVEVEGKTGLPSLFGKRRLDYEPQRLAERIDGRTISAEQALLEFLADHNMSWVAKRLQSMNLLEIVATAAPGLKDILVLGKVKQLDLRGEYDLIIVDSPAAGHTLTFLGSASGLEDAARMGPVQTQAQEVNALLTDTQRCNVVLVALAEETPVNETMETADALAELGIRVSGVVVNGWYPEGESVSVDAIQQRADEADVMVPGDEAAALAEAAEFRAMRHRLQVEQLARLEDHLTLPMATLPYLFTADFGPDQIDILVTEFTSQLVEQAA